MIDSKNCITHRCEGSLKQGLSIRINDEGKWTLYKPTNEIYGNRLKYWYLRTLTEIEFCPYCGQQLIAINLK